MRILANRVLLLCLLVPALICSVDAAQYVFTNITDTAGPFDAFDDAAINNSGVVAFSARPRGSTYYGVYVGSGGAITSVTEDTTSYLSFQSSINDSGSVAFYRAHIPSRLQGIYVWTDGQLTTITDTTGSLTKPLQPSINNSGAVVFRANPTSGGQGLFVGSGGSVTTLYQSDAQFYGFSEPFLANDGTVVFTGHLTGGGQGIYTGNGGSLTTIAETGSAFSSVGLGCLNDSGTVAFLAVAGSGQSFDTLCLGDGGAVEIIADTTGTFSSFSAPSINGSGTIAFGAGLKSGGQGVFTGPDAIADKVVASGDTLLGSSLTGVGTSTNRALNDKGQIVFLYTLANGVQGVAVATPARSLTLGVINSQWGTATADPDLPAYPVGSLVTLTASPIQGKCFGHWEIYDPDHPDDSNYATIDANSVTHVVMNADRQVRAVFAAVPETSVYAVLVGAEETMYLGFSLHGHKDAIVMYCALRSLPNARAENIHLLDPITSDTPNPKTLVLDKIREVKPKVRSGDTFILFVASHGNSSGGRLDLKVGLDGNGLPDEQTQLLVEDICPELASFNSQANKVVIFPGCYTGSFWEVPGLVGLKAIPNTCLFAGSPADQPANFIPDIGIQWLPTWLSEMTPSPMGMSPLAICLAYGLCRDCLVGHSPADLNWDGTITYQELKSFAATAHSIGFFIFGDTTRTFQSFTGDDWPILDAMGTLMPFTYEPNISADPSFDGSALSRPADAALRLNVTNSSWGSIDITPTPNDANLPRYALGSDLTLTATAVQGKHFGGWTVYDPNFPDDANYATVDANATTVITMNSDLRVDAAFRCGTGLGSILPLTAIGLMCLVVIRRRS